MRDPSLLTGTPIIEHLPGELRRGPASPPRFVLALVGQLLLLSLLIPLGLGLAPLYLVVVAVHGWPPNVVSLAQAWRYLGYTRTVRPPVRLALLHRAWLRARILRRVALIPVLGLAWLLDEVLYGRRLDGVAIVEPLIQISAARSGSTQMARYLEDDPELVAPPILHCLFPYLWLWRLVAATIGRFVAPAEVNARFVRSLRPEFMERHEGDLFRTDTFEGPFFLFHLNGLAPFLGPEVFHAEFNLGEAAPHNRALWHQTFVELFDRIARKTLVWHDADRSPAPPRLFIKGHFLAAADSLERRYPDARFLTMIRHPAKRLRSMVNFLRVNPLDATLGEPPWATIGPGLAASAVRYCEVERAWFTRVGARRCVVPFRTYVADLDGTMATIYRECLDRDELPDHVPREHPPRRRSNYAIDRTLAEFGVDQARLEARLADYIAWCEAR